MVLLPVLFAMRIGDGRAWAQALITAGAFCLLSSTVYVINDILDRDKDRIHPVKRNRPLAAGTVTLSSAAMLAGLSLLLAAVLWSLLLVISPQPNRTAWPVGGVLLAYLLLQIAYSLRLKRVLILDVICIALGFVLRALAGALAIGVVVSPWLFVMAFTLCLFMGFCKRFSEQASLSVQDHPEDHRATLAGYRNDLLTHLVTLSASISVIAMVLYSLDERTVRNFGSNFLVYTLPIFLYGVFRFAMLSMAGRYPGPTELILRDRPFQLTVALWMLSAAAIIYWGPQLRDILAGAG